MCAGSLQLSEGCVCRVSPALSTVSRFQLLEFREPFPCSVLGSPLPCSLHPALTHHSWRSSQTTAALLAARKQKHSSHLSAQEDEDEGSDRAATEFLPEPALQTEQVWDAFPHLGPARVTYLLPPKMVIK